MGVVRPTHEQAGVEQACGFSTAQASSRAGEVAQISWQQTPGWWSRPAGSGRRAPGPCMGRAMGLNCRQPQTGPYLSRSAGEASRSMGHEVDLALELSRKRPATFMPTRPNQGV